LGSTVYKAMKVHFVNVDNGELDHLGDLSDVTSGLLGFSGPLVAISKQAYDKKDSDGQEHSSWTIDSILSSDEIGNYTAYMEHCIKDGIIQTPGQESWDSNFGMRNMISKAFNNAKEASLEEFSSMGYEVFSLPKFQFDLFGSDRDLQPVQAKKGLFADKVLCLIDSDEAAKQSVIDTFTGRVLTSRKDGISMPELMWDVRPWMIKESYWALNEQKISPSPYPMPERLGASPTN